MNSKVQDVIDSIAADIKALVDTIMEGSAVSDNRSSIKELRDSVRKEDVTVKVSSGGGGGVVIDVLYDSVLEWDRKPQTGKQPSISDIVQWASAKGLSTDNKTINLIRRSIWWLGHSGRPITDLLDQEIDRMLEKEWTDKLAEAMLAELDDVLE